jgi:hypothetical protein
MNEINDPAALLALGKKIQAAARESGAQEELNHRTRQLIESGQKPELICFLQDPSSHTPLARITREPEHKALLLFTSPILAHFFLRTRQMPFQVAGVKLDEIATVAEDWGKRGFDAFILDLSPKAPLFNVVPVKDNLITCEALVFAWATGRTIRNWQAQMRLAEFYGKTNPGQPFPEALTKQRAALETLRDFGSFDVPFVHWMIALIAGMQGDESARLAATATLESFGPAFVGKTTRIEGREGEKAWAESMAAAQVGLLAEYGMLKGPDGSPVGSILRSETMPPPASPS